MAQEKIQSLELIGDVSGLASKVVVMERLFEILTLDLKFRDFVREILVSVLEVIPCEAGSILEINHKEENFFFRAAAGRVSDTIVKFVVPLKKGVVGHVIESMQPMVLQDTAENSLHLSTLSHAVGFDVKTLAAYPIVIRGRPFGVLELINRIGEPGFTEMDTETLDSIMQFISKAIEVRLMISWSKQIASKKVA